uniref:Uncharacterized protein n=1 Tax=Aegilops tauschii subsp. strangulata TaxID=200361 RepID=A0A452XT95_AEGTS
MVEMGSETFVEILLAILLPPVGVFLRYGIGGVLDLPAAHAAGLHPRHHLRHLRPRRIACSPINQIGLLEIA